MTATNQPNHKHLDSDAAPVLTGDAPPAGVTQALYLNEPGAAFTIDVTDIHQGALSDCFVLASMGELALNYPASIPSMIHDNGNGTDTVTLYAASTGALPTFGTTAFKPVPVTVPDSFSPLGVNGTYSISQDVVGTQQEIWPQVLEESVAYLNGGYPGIANGGSPALAMEELTGQAATWMSPSAMTWAGLLSDMSAKDLLVFDTANSQSLPFGLVGDHAYMLAGVDGTNQTVQLLNPWGYNNPPPIPFSQLAAAGITETDIGHVAPPTSTAVTTV